MIWKYKSRKKAINKSNMTSIPIETLALFEENFNKAVKGYHILNESPIKETVWEDINTLVLNASGCPVESQSKGSHKPGGDISGSLGGLSNKSSKYESDRKGFGVSSYRLTAVCSDRSPGKIEDILAEINSRKDFKFYSIIMREELEGQIKYDWLMIPSDYPAMDPATYTWRPKLGNRGKNKGSVVGWETDVINGSSMSISFSMSSQLWIHVNVTEDMRPFVVGSCAVSTKRKYDYIQLFDKETEM